MQHPRRSGLAPAAGYDRVRPVAPPPDRPKAKARSTVLKVVSRVVRLLVGIGAIAVAVLIVVVLVKTRPAPNMLPLTESALAVRAAQAQRVSLPQRWSAFGTVRPMDAADIAAEVSGRVVERPAGLEAGTAVRAGDTLIRIESSDFASRVAALKQRIEALRAQISGLEVEEASLGEQVQLAQEDAELAERELDRARQSVAAGAGNESAVDVRRQAVARARQTLEALRQQLDLIPTRRAQLNAQLAADRADLSIAERELARTNVVSPVTGVVREMFIDEGEWIRTGEPVARVVDLRRLEVPLRVPAGAAGLVAVGNEAEVRRDSAARSVWSGRVSRVSPEADPLTRTIEVYVEVEQSDAVGPDGLPKPGSEILLPGQFVTATVRGTTPIERLAIPRRVVDGDRVLIAQPILNGDPAGDGSDGSLMRVREVEVNVLRFDSGPLPMIVPGESQWAVLNDRGVLPDRALRAGDWMLLSNLEQLRPGMLVRVEPVLDEGEPNAVPVAKEARP